MDDINDFQIDLFYKNYKKIITIQMMILISPECLDIQMTYMIESKIKLQGYNL